jgi:hypothetical protein
MFYICSIYCREGNLKHIPAITRNVQGLIGIVAILSAMVGMTSGQLVARIERSLRLEVLRILRPAEAALRRLIYVAAQGLVVKPVARAALTGAVRETLKGLKSKTSSPVFQLSDPRLPIRAFDDVDADGEPVARHSKLTPRMTVIGPPDPTVAAVWAHKRIASVSHCAQIPSNDHDEDLIDATRLIGRLQAISAALQDIPKHAKRLARWTARRRVIANTRLVYTSPLRNGPPPGYQKEPIHEVDHILKTCHWLAYDAQRADTS